MLYEVITDFETACSYYLFVEHGRFPSEWLSLSFAERATIAEFLDVITSYSIHYTKLYDERADAKLLDFARGEITKAGLPVESLSFLKGKDEAETASRVTAFKTMYDTAVQAAVEARFKSAGYDPAKSSEPPASTGDTLESRNNFV